MVRGFEGILAFKGTGLFESDRRDTMETEHIDFTGFKLGVGNCLVWYKLVDHGFDGGCTAVVVHIAFIDHMASCHPFDQLVRTGPNRLGVKRRRVNIGLFG